MEIIQFQYFYYFFFFLEVFQNKNFVERPAKPQKRSSLGKDNNSHPPGGLPGTKKSNEAVSYK